MPPVNADSKNWVGIDLNRQLEFGRSETSLGRRHAFNARIQLDGHAQRPPERLECGFSLMMRVVTFKAINVQRDQGVVSEALKKFVNEIHIEFANARPHKVNFEIEA